MKDLFSEGGRLTTYHCICRWVLLATGAVRLKGGRTRWPGGRSGAVPLPEAPALLSLTGNVARTWRGLKETLRTWVWFTGMEKSREEADLERKMLNFKCFNHWVCSWGKIPVESPASWRRGRVGNLERDVVGDIYLHVNAETRSEKRPLRDDRNWFLGSYLYLKGDKERRACEGVRDWRRVGGLWFPQSQGRSAAEGARQMKTKRRSLGLVSGGQW